MSIYWYDYGVNWRTVVAWVCAIFPRYALPFFRVASQRVLTRCSMPGFVNSVNPALKVDKGGSHVFSLSFVLGFWLGESTHPLVTDNFADNV